MRARCDSGPFVGQTLQFRLPWETVHFYVDWNKKQLVGPLVWINHGTDKHCYQVTSNGWRRGYRLVYRDTF